MRRGDEAIDIREPLEELIRRLGFEYHDVAELRIEPGTVIVTAFAPNADGKKYVLREGRLAGYAAMIRTGRPVKT